MTRFKQRLRGEEQMLRRWRERYGFNSALDAACGTGLHAVVLAQMGVKATAADPSAAMLDQARRHALEEGVDVRFVQSQFSALESRIRDRFGAVWVLGNSLPHVLTRAELAASLSGLARVLDAQGILIVQLLNYERILTSRDRIVGVNREQEKYFVRFYDFLEELVQFNVLVIATSGEKISHRLTSTLLRPYRLPALVQAFEASGLQITETFGDMSFSPFDPGSSPNLVIVAKRRE
ncbi:MAG: class I SAM-dependent methyltransferase [Acidobacteria bacterium]|nr:MAG: class I SAM-dependent methyltransferase [Acidobacteriota bacterium]